MSPADVERAQPHHHRQREGRSRPAHNRSWSQQLLYGASGLTVALSDVSRRNLIYCLHLLSRSAEHIATVTSALRLVLEQYDQAREHWHRRYDSAVSDEKGSSERPQTPDHDDAARHLAALIKKHCDDIWHTMKQVVHSVSVTIGGALPESYRRVVREQLMSLPARWGKVGEEQRDAAVGVGETSGAARRMIGFAMEGLDVIEGVSGVCRTTLDSAEGWMRVAGRSRRGSRGEGGRTGLLAEKRDHAMEEAGEDEEARIGERQ